MPRKKQLRKIVEPPKFIGYKPYGASPGLKKGFVELLYEEYEAIKLADYDFLNHVEAAQLMGISRPTFARIYESARRKIAKALTECKEIKTVYGNAYLDKKWNVCLKCYARYTTPINVASSNCPICGSDKNKKISK